MIEVSLVGDLHLDILTSPIDKIRLEIREEGEVFTSIGGNASNTAVALSSLGVKTQLFCAISKDAFGGMLEDRLKRRGIRLFASHKEASQAITVGLNFSDGKRFFFGDHCKTNMLFSPGDIPKDKISGKIFFSGGFWFTPLMWRGLKGIFSHTKKSGILNCMDVCWDHEGFPPHKIEAFFSVLPFLDYLFLNPAELKGICKENLSLSIKRVLDIGVGNIVLHQGSKGATLVKKDGRMNSPAFKTEIRNPTGTGDVFNAGFIYGLLKNLPPEKCLRMGNAAASLHLGGKSYPSLENVNKLL
jgi:sugar/nucleoside kinase (ribokinase family)